MVTLKLFGNLRKHIDGTHLRISGENVRAVMENLCDDYPSLCDDLLENDKIRPHYKIMINGHDISLLDGVNTAVRVGDQIAIFPPIAGG